MAGLIVGLFGPQRSGKNEVVNHLVEKHGFVGLSISHAIKEHAYRLLDIPAFPDAVKDTPQVILNGKTPRDLYVHIGQIDEYKPALWVDHVVASMAGNPNGNYVIESVGKLIQWKALLLNSPIRDIELVEVRRPGKFYQDNRSHIYDRYFTSVIENVFDIKWLHNQVDLWVDRRIPLVRGMAADLDWMEGRVSAEVRARRGEPSSTEATQ